MWPYYLFPVSAMRPSPTTTFETFIIISIICHFCVGSMFQISHVHSARSCASSSNNLFFVKMCSTLSRYFRFGLAFLLFAGTFITTLLPSYTSPLLVTCPCHFDLHFLGCFSHLCCPSNCFVSCSVRLVI